MTKSKRIFVLDDHPLTREGIAGTIARQKDFEVCGQAGSLSEGRDGIDRERPDLVVSDFRFAKGDTLAFVRELKERHPGLPVVIVSMLEELVYAGRCIDAGALAFVSKAAPTEDLLAAVEDALAGNVWLSKVVINAQFQGRQASANNSLMHVLSNRELQVFRMIGEGTGRQEIAAALGVAETTVDSHKEHIKEKLKITSAADLATQATLWVQGQL